MRAFATSLPSLSRASDIQRVALAQLGEMLAEPGRWGVQVVPFGDQLVVADGVKVRHGVTDVDSECVDFPVGARGPRWNALGLTETGFVGLSSNYTKLV